MIVNRRKGAESVLRVTSEKGTVAVVSQNEEPGSGLFQSKQLIVIKQFQTSETAWRLRLRSCRQTGQNHIFSPISAPPVTRARPRA
jgi:hypothetical protein